MPRDVPGTATIAAVTAGLFPFVAIVAPKATVVLIVICGSLSLVHVARRGAWRELCPAAVTVIFAVFAAWALYKSLATAEQWTSIGLWFRLMAVVLSGFGAVWLFGSLSPMERRGAHDALIAGIVAGLVVLLIAPAIYALSGFTLFGRGSPNPMTALSPGQVVMAMVSAVAWGVLIQRRRRVAAAMLGAATLIGFLPLSSSLAIAVLLLGTLGMAWGLLTRLPGTRLLIALLVVAAVMSPPLATELLRMSGGAPGDSPTVTKVIRQFDLTGRLENSIRHRFQIWAFVIERARERPVLDFGWGLDASRRIPGTHKSTSLNAERLPLHPHNAFLQAWLELGTPGVALLSIIMGYAAFAGLRRGASSLACAVRAGTLLATLTAAMLAYGLWQNWWVAALFLTAAISSSFRDATQRGSAAGTVRILVNGIHAKSGGGANYLRNLIPLLAREDDLEIHLCIGEEQHGQWADSGDEIKVHVLPARSGIWSLALAEQWLVPVLAGRIGAEVTFSPANYGPIFAPNPVIMLRNAMSVAAMERRPRMILYWVAVYVATAASLVTARAAISVSDYARRAIASGPLRPFRDRVTVIPHGVGPPYSNSVEKPERDEFVLSVSDIYVQKNFPRLIRAFAIVHAGHPNTKLIIAGRPIDTQLFDELRNMVESESLQNHVEFLGEVAADRLAELYCNCRLFVFPSLVETFGNPLVEAMACGAPIASARRAAMPEVLDDAAIYFNPMSEGDMAAAINRLLNEPMTRSELSAKGRLRAENYSWKQTAQRTAAILRKTAGRKAAIP